MKSSTAFTRKYFKKISAALILLLITLAGALFSFVFILHEVLWEKEEAVDNSILNFLSANVINNRLTDVMKAITYFASAGFLQIAYAALVLLYLLIQNWKRAIEIAALGIGGFIINYCMKLSFHRTRPPYPLIGPLQNFSFPSGHATSGFIFYGLLVYLLWKTNITKLYKFTGGFILISFSIVIGFSRVYLRVHYPSDVIAGFCIGFAWLSLAIWMFERLKKQLGKELKQVK